MRGFCEALTIATDVRGSVSLVLNRLAELTGPHIGKHPPYVAAGNRQRGPPVRAIYQRSVPYPPTIHMEK